MKDRLITGQQSHTPPTGQQQHTQPQTQEHHWMMNNMMFSHSFLNSMLVITQWGISDNTR